MEVQNPAKSLAISDSAPQPAKPVVGETEDDGGERAKAPEVLPSLGSPTAAAAMAVAQVSGPAATDLQKKLQRAQRFGTPVLLSEEEKRNSRAERFGTTPILAEKSEQQKRKARAERFGTAEAPSSDEEAKKKARLLRFGLDSKGSSSKEEEKMKARAIRFAQPENSQTNGKAETNLTGKDDSVDKSDAKT